MSKSFSLINYIEVLSVYKCTRLALHPQFFCLFVGKCVCVDFIDEALCLAPWLHTVSVGTAKKNFLKYVNRIDIYSINYTLLFMEKHKTHTHKIYIR